MLRTVEMNAVEHNIITQLNQAIQELQGKLQIAMAMVMAAREVEKFTVIKMENNLVTIDDGTVENE